MKAKDVYRLHLKTLDKLQNHANALNQIVRELKDMQADIEDLQELTAPKPGFRKPRGGDHAATDLPGSAQ